MRPMLTALILFSTLAAFGQTDYPQGYFRDPLDIPISLSGNFGELRPNHYHMGIDIKTNKRENLPVYAAAEGYVSRIKIEPAGFGRAIYITHPNGYTTVYGHLNNFAAKIDAFLKQQQYAKESWKMQIDLPPSQFPVKKGEFIAFSGNTGGSEAPHVHFEIRRTKDDVNLNPLLFGMPLKDNVKPRIFRLAVYDRTRSVYEQTPKIFPVKLNANGYETTPRILKIGAPLVSFAITAFDTHTNSSNLNGIFDAILKVNNENEESFQMDNISYNQTRNLNAHIDYRYKALGGGFLQHLTELPGYINSIYANGNGHGVIDISDGAMYEISVEVSDAEGNVSELKTNIQYDFNKATPPVAPGKMFYPLALDGFETDDCEFYIGEKCLFDSVHIAYKHFASGDPMVVSEVNAIGANYIPLGDSFLIRIKPIMPLSPEDKKFTVMQWFYGAKSSVQRVQWQNEWAFAKFREFGNFQLVTDTVPPVIVPIGFVDGSNLSKAARIAYKVKDNLKTIKNVRAELDGHWLRFTNDKSLSFIYYFDEKCQKGKHTLNISADDEAGNHVSKDYHFTR
ncbi:MAG: M23 family metallopeptidase [Flavitalea sp.]